MSKSMRVYQLARELEVESKELLRLLNDEMHIDVNNHMSTINAQVASRLRQMIKGPSPADQAGQKEDKPKGGATGGKQPAAKQAPARQGQAQRGREGSSERAPAKAVDATTDDATPVETPEKLANREKIRRRQKEQEDREAARRRRRGNGRRDAGRRPRYNVAESITIRGPISVGDLAHQLQVPAAELIKSLMALGTLATINEQLDPETAAVAAEGLGARAVIDLPEAEPSDDQLLENLLEEDRAEGEEPRAPVVVVLGHVDHGKTSLLDAIRSTKVTKSEAGGITQHIGASEIRKNGKRIVFLDTPGHEAFTAMRARGARVTDIAVLVVAADDGVMPQTVEAINHAKDAGIPLVVAINKMDRPDANPDRVKQQLAEHGLIPEDWGGDTITVPVSAVKGEGIDDLLEMINLVAEIQELKASPNRPGVGTVIEAKIDKGRGPVATVLIQTGSLRQGDNFVAGLHYGRVRAMINDMGQKVKKASPATAVEILGFSDVPRAGDIFRVIEDEKKAREIAQKRQDEHRQEELTTRRGTTLAEFYSQMQEGELKELKLVLKADVQGSLEALRGTLQNVDAEQDETRVSIIHGGVGAISESDVMLAAASGAIIIGFNVRPDSKANQVAEREQVEIKTYRVIYDILDDVRAALQGMLDPEIEEVVLGRAEVRATFKVPNVGVVAGTYVTEGSIRRNASIRLIRDGVVVHEGQIHSLKRFQDDVREVAQGYECGIGLERFNDVKEGDVLEAYEEREVPR